ncbi:MAG: 4-(cytidine 5'-diphospho)-2-C-methyl-D-erythritol kinase [Paludibacteraceae bacterium]|nr:4-(cytidine 5'-diphospho)-2-C-methyl-D-erythritol kinase [Paludibacteraceae bacterium]
MKVYPNAKINLGLQIVGKRPDGYHLLQTVFYPIPWCDELSVEPAERLSFEQDGLSVGCDSEQNLVMKAYRLLAGHFALPAMRIGLCKHIPFGAGLGGGSSDAAFMLKAVNQLCCLGLSAAELELLAARLGADCAFFIRNEAVFAGGIGTDFEPMAPIDLRGWHLVLVKPSFGVSTAEAYRHVSVGRPAFDLHGLAALPVESWREVVVNDFEASVFPQYPLLATIKQSLYGCGAAYAAMSGSGSTMFGLFKNLPDTKMLHQYGLVQHFEL